MSENKHRPEPWYCENCGEGFDIYDSNDHSIIDGSFGLIECESNARRIVACVNACAGIPNEQLECDNVEFVRIFNERNTLKKQRDELLAALECARESLDAIRLAVEPYDDIKPRDWKSDRANLRDAHTSAKETIEAVDAVIVSVKGGAG